MTTFYYYLANYQSVIMRTTLLKLICMYLIINLRNKIVFKVPGFWSYEAGKVCHLAHSELPSLPRSRHCNLVATWDVWRMILWNLGGRIIFHRENWNSCLWGWLKITAIRTMSLIMLEVHKKLLWYAVFFWLFLESSLLWFHHLKCPNISSR